jgi:hypothetical protein
MKNAAIAVGASAWLAATVAGAAREAPPPSDTVTVDVGGLPLTLWPYTFEEPAPPGAPSDPVSLVFLGSDPREIRQALMQVSGDRTAPPYPGGPFFPNEPPFNCTWTDAMGYDQAAWAEQEGWVGGEVQLACVGAGAPLGNPFRFHLRLFREGDLTLGAAHFEFLIPGTAEHEALSWDFAQTFVTLDMIRTGTLTASPSPVSLVPAGTFRAVRRPVYDALLAGGAGPILALAGLPVPSTSTLPPAGAPIPIPTNGAAMVFAPRIAFEPVQARTRTELDVTYGVVTTKPFCGGPTDYVLLKGPVHLALRTHTNPSGMYSRTYLVSGSLSVTPGYPDGMGGFVATGPPVPAVVSESHRALLTDHYGEVSELGAQTLLSDPLQSLAWSLRAGHVDRFVSSLTCGTAP